jgi:tol-pal system protein YbgF
MRANASRCLAIAALIAGAGMLAPDVQAQPQQNTARPQAPAAASRASPPAAAREAQAPGGDAALRQRVEQLEEQLVDMQVVVGTLESLAKGVTAPAASGLRPAPGGAAAVNAADAGRLDALETQIRALAAQLEQLTDQVRTLGAGRSGALAPSSSPQALNEQGPGPRPGRPQVEGNAAPTERTGFGSVVVAPDSAKRDDINRLLSSSRPGGPPPAAQEVASAPPQAEPDANPKQLYETAYGYLLQRDYAAAEAAFDDFLKRHPNDPMAANAQYWLGESLYVRGQYRAAASAFLKGYQNHARSAKAPESLLKLAMSLQRLGQKDAACSSYSELTTKYPNAPAHVKNTANSERQRNGC